MKCSCRAPKRAFEARLADSSLSLFTALFTLLLTRVNNGLPCSIPGGPPWKSYSERC